MTTPAVLCPTPGRASKASKFAGTLPSCRSSKSSARRFTFFALLLARPQVLMHSRMSATDRRAIFCGVGPISKSAGVTKFTRLSVHCAERRTATSRVKGSV